MGSSSRLLPVSTVRSRQAAPGQLELGLIEDAIAIRDLLAGEIGRHTPAARLVAEMGVTHGAGRIDLAAIGDDLEGYEIKADRDDLTRLPGQVELYGAVFGRLTLVAAPRHIDKAMQLLPAWWGVSVVDGEQCRLTTLRAPAPNPSRDPLAIARLLWRDEVAAALRERTGRASRAPRLMLWRQLVECVPEVELRALVCESLRQRSGWLAAC